jgi:cytochrome c
MLRASHLVSFIAVAAVLIRAGASFAATEDPAVGAELFKSRCGICHSPEAGTNKIGPSLFNVVGRPAGSIEDYPYSDANRRSGIVWDLAALDRYLTAPQAMVPGTKMTFPGIKNDEQRAAVIAYLNTLRPQVDAH